MKAYITIHFETHDYTATVTKPGQLETFLSKKTEKFTIGEMTGAPGLIPGLAQEMNRISHFWNHAGRRATARG